MKLLTVRSAALAFFIFMAACAANAQTMPMTGAYGPADVSSNDVKRAAAAAITKHSKTKDRVTLVNIVKAERQLVEGMNYRLCMVVQDRKRKQKTVTAIIYETPNGIMHPGAWQTGKCKEL
jgi:hypothetical protein